MLSNSQMNPENKTTPNDKKSTIPLPTADQNPDICPIDTRANINEIAARKKINMIIGSPNTCP
jgi:hypothetical protein